MITAVMGYFYLHKVQTGSNLKLTKFGKVKD